MGVVGDAAGGILGDGRRRGVGQADGVERRGAVIAYAARTDVLDRRDIGESQAAVPVSIGPIDRIDPLPARQRALGAPALSGGSGELEYRERRKACALKESRYITTELNAKEP